MTKHPQPKNVHLYNNCPEQPTTSAWEAVDKLEALSEQPKSQCKCIDCNLPELESLGHEPTKPSRATKENLTPIIEPKTGVGLTNNVSQPPEQPNTELLIVKTIQGLMTCVNNNLDKLSFNREQHKLVCKAKVEIGDLIERVDLFEKTTLFELQKAFE